jgi:hypothetical protein
MVAEPRDLLRLPADLPAPVDDGACDHPPGPRLPAPALPAPDGSSVDLSALPGCNVVQVYLCKESQYQPFHAG